jgi:hypothetical protein
MLGVIAANGGRTTAFTASSPAYAMVSADDMALMPGLQGDLTVRQEEASDDDNTDRRAERAG